jgi:hypothetical protein
LGSLRKSLLILKSLRYKDKDYWIAEYPVETELYILSKVIRDLTKWHRYLIELAYNSKNTTGAEIANHMLDAVAEVYLYLLEAKDRFKHLRSKHPIPVWITQIVNRLKPFLRKFL